MCGIVGQLNFDGKPCKYMILLKRMTDEISHRGPDGEGHWYKGEVGFGHRRLAIINFSFRANQPMISADHDTLAYNGEVYNFQELRNELVEKGYNFKSNSDSEVVLYSLIEWKEKLFSSLMECLHFLFGMKIFKNPFTRT